MQGTEGHFSLRVRSLVMQAPVDDHTFVYTEAEQIGLSELK